jgi:hypothetical protein
MKTALFIEDTPGGLKTKFVWQSNGHMDHAAESISMNVMANLTLFIKEMEDQKLLKIAKEEVGRPGEPPEASTLS